jgi:glycosyltransferase involved in cell wall biosynthesis
MRKTLLFVNQSQFGYHIDYLQYCKHLKEDFEITYLCWDYKRERIQESGINVIYVSRDNNILIRNIRFLKINLNVLKQKSYTKIFIHFFRGSFIIPLLSAQRKKIHLDIRTGSISTKKINRSIYNIELRFESIFFRSVSVISSGLRDMLGISKSAIILPLGATPLYVTRQFKKTLSLLYVGTLSNRHIEETVEGLKIFLKEHTNADISYTIVGDGWHNEKLELQNRINKLHLQKYITLTGYLPHSELRKFYQITNVGVSYIPITSYYEFQPATKTYEYLMAGMPVIATNTYENRQVVNEINGVLIQDSPESFAIGVADVFKRLNSFDENKIRKTVENYEWSKIVQTMKNTILK